MKLDFVGMGIEVVILILGFAVGWGRLSQRLDDHIKLIAGWQAEVAEWRKGHETQARERASIVSTVEKLLERQQVMNEYVRDNLAKINDKLWP